MNFKLNQYNLKSIVEDICSFSQEEFNVFKEKHTIFFADKNPSKEEITNAFMEKNMLIGFSYEYSSSDCVFYILFRDEAITEKDRFIQDWDANNATK